MSRKWLVSAGVLVLAAGGVVFAMRGGSEPVSAPASTAASAPVQQVEQTQEAEQGMPTYRINQAWDVDSWRIKVTGVRCGSAKQLGVEGEELAGSEDACVVAVSYTNTGRVPATFDGGSDAEPGPAYATGLDAQGRVYEGFNWAQGEVNPGLGGKTDLVFGVPTGTKLTTVTIGDAAVQL